MNELRHTDFDDFSPHISSVLLEVPQFRTKKEALLEGAKFGWKSAVRLHRRFESVWVVGKKDFQPDEVGKNILSSPIRIECFRFPLLRWEHDERGVQFVPVLVCRRPIKLEGKKDE